MRYDGTVSPILSQQVCGCDGVLFVLLQEKKEKGFREKDAQASI